MESRASIAIGSFRIAFLTDGLWWNDGGCMFGVVPRELWKREHAPDEKNRIRLNLTCPLVIRGREAILIDTGIGNRLSDVERKIFGHEEGWLLDGLRAIGMEPGDITGVVLSHLHFDHCGGVVRRRPSGELEAAFPRARYFVQRGEVEAAGADNERLRAAYRHIDECLAPIRPRLELVSGDISVLPGLDAVVTGGHTADHQIAMVREGDECFIHLADICPTRSHIKGPWNQSYDLDPLTTMERKAHYLRKAVAEHWWISFAHDDRVFTAHARMDRGRMELADIVPVPQ